MLANASEFQSSIQSEFDCNIIYIPTKLALKAGRLLYRIKTGRNVFIAEIPSAEMSLCAWQEIIWRNTSQAAHYKGIYPLQLCHQILPVAYGYRHCAFTFQLERKTPSFCLLWLTFWGSVIFLLFGETKHPGSQRKPIQQDINICYSGNLNDGLVI